MDSSSPLPVLPQVDNTQQQILVEIQELFEGFFILKSVNQSQNPGVVIRYLEKIFGDGEEQFQVECDTLMKIHRVFQVYKRFSRLVPEEAPIILVENLENIFQLETPKFLCENQEISTENENRALEISQERPVSQQGEGQGQGQGQGSVSGFPIASSSKASPNSNGNNQLELEKCGCKFCFRPFPNEYFLKKHETHFCPLKTTPSQNSPPVSKETLPSSKNSSASASAFLHEPEPHPKSAGPSSISSGSNFETMSKCLTSVTKWLQVQNQNDKDDKILKKSASCSSSIADGFLDYDSGSESSISACTTLTSGSGSEIDPLSLPAENVKTEEVSVEEYPAKIENQNENQQEEEEEEYREKGKEAEDSQIPFQCVYCDKIYRNLKNLNLHIKVHTGDYDFQCEHCLKPFVYPSQLKIHMKVHKNAFPCRISECTKTYKTKGMRNRHEALHKKQIETDGNLIPSQNQTISNPPKTNGMKLKLKAKSKSKGNGKKTVKTVTKSGKMKNPKIFTNKNPCGISKLPQRKGKNRKTNPRKIYECPVCKKQLATANTLYNHRRAQHSNRSFRCRFCIKTFKYSSNRASHEKMHKGQAKKKVEASEKDPSKRNCGNVNFGNFLCRFENCAFKTYDRISFAQHFCQVHTKRLLENPVNRV